MRSLPTLTLVALLLAAGSASAADRHNRRVHIINETTQTLFRLYASNVGTDVWEEDILDLDVIDVGRSIVANIDDGTRLCLFDFKFVFENNEELIQNRVDVCKIGVIRLSEDQSQAMTVSLED